MCLAQGPQRSDAGEAQNVIQNEFAVFILSIIPIDTDRIENFGLFFLQSQNFVYFLVHLSRRLIDELMVCTGICGSLLSCEAHSICHL